MLDTTLNQKEFKMHLTAKYLSSSCLSYMFLMRVHHLCLAVKFRVRNRMFFLYYPSKWQIQLFFFPQFAFMSANIHTAAITWLNSSYVETTYSSALESMLCSYYILAYKSVLTEALQSP